MRWTVWLDLAAVGGLGLATWGVYELCGRPAALIWGGAWITGLAVWVAAGVSGPRKP